MTGIVLLRHVLFMCCVVSKSVCLILSSSSIQEIVMKVVDFISYQVMSFVFIYMFRFPIEVCRIYVTAHNKKYWLAAQLGLKKKMLYCPLDAKTWFGQSELKKKKIPLWADISQF